MNDLSEVITANSARALAGIIAIQASHKANGNDTAADTLINIMHATYEQLRLAGLSHAASMAKVRAHTTTAEAEFSEQRWTQHRLEVEAEKLAG